MRACTMHVYGRGKSSTLTFVLAHTLMHALCMYMEALIYTHTCMHALTYIHRAALHFDPQIASSRHASGIGGHLVQTTFKQFDSTAHVEVSVGEEMTIDIVLVCRQPALWLVVGA